MQHYWQPEQMVHIVTARPYRVNLGAKKSISLPDWIPTAFYIARSIQFKIFDFCLKPNKHFRCASSPVVVDGRTTRCEARRSTVFRADCLEPTGRRGRLGLILGARCMQMLRASHCPCSERCWMSPPTSRIIAVAHDCAGTMQSLWAHTLCPL
jgi:hypothetical protein